MKISVIDTGDLIKEFVDYLKNHSDSQVVSQRTFRLSVDYDGIVHLLTVGGGLAAFSKMIIEYVKLTKQQRRILIKKSKNNVEIDVSGMTAEEVEEMLIKANSIVLLNSDSIEEE